MEIYFKDGKLKKLCENRQKLIKKYGNEQANKIIQRILELQAFENLYDASKLPQLRLHPLEGNFDGCFGINVIQPFRMIIAPENGSLSDYRTINKITIINARINYH